MLVCRHLLLQCALSSAILLLGSCAPLPLKFCLLCPKLYSFGQLLSAFLCIYRHHRVVTDGLAQPVDLCSVWIWVVGLPRLSWKKPPEMKEACNLAWLIFCAFSEASVSYVWCWCVECCAWFFSIVIPIIVYDESTAQKQSFCKDACEKLVINIKVERHHTYWNRRKVDVLKAMDIWGSTVWCTLTLKNKHEIKE